VLKRDDRIISLCIFTEDVKSLKNRLRIHLNSCFKLRLLKQTGRNILLLFWFTGIFIGCSTKKNTPATRAYHNVSARYNVYFNAKESLKAGISRINQTIPDDYTNILPIFKCTLPEAAKVASSEMELAITKCNKLISLHSITKSPDRKPNNSERYKKFASKGEFNKWIDDSYVLMGKASYYNHDFHRAIENFNYVIRRFPDQPTRYDALLGMARSYIETGDSVQATGIFSTLSRDGGFPNRLKQELSLTQAHYYLKNNQPDLAIVHLKTALQTKLPRYDKLRTNYILAQLLTLTNQPDEASKQYLRIIKMRPGYQMTFNARISRMEIIGGDNKDIEHQLQDMLDNQINMEYRDRIYYAKAKIAIKEGRKPDAVSDLKKSVQYSLSNPKQRAMSSLDVARMLFEENDYLQSSCYYDSAVMVIDASYPGYAEIITRSSGLKRLSLELNKISREDSLQRLALMPEIERNAFINKIIADIQLAESLRATAENSEMANQNYFRSQQFRQQPDGSSNLDNQNLWYFYNLLTVGIGKSDFQKIWGKRKLEDNWRRKNKLTTVEADTEQGVDSVSKNVASDAKRKVNDPKTLAYYLQDIPLTDSLMQTSNEIIKSALFSAGRIYRTEFNDFVRSAETFEELNRRYKGSIYELPAFFELYQLYKQGGDLPKTDELKQKIISGYSESKYAKYLLNPNYFAEVEQRKLTAEKKYSESLREFQSFNFVKAREEALATLATDPDSSLLPKVKFIAVVSNGATQDRTLFSAALDQYIKEFPKGQTTDIALQIKDLIATNSLTDYQQLLAKGYIREELANEEMKRDKDHSNDEFGGKFSYDGDMFHYYVIAFAKDRSVDASRLIYDISNYNLDYYTSTDFDIEQVNLDSKTQLVVVRSIPNKEEGLIYFRSIIRKRPVFKALKGIEYVNFVTSSTNYRTIIAEKDYLTYLRFFIKNYSSYISSDIPADELPNPQELLAKARKEEEAVEKGKFVLIQPVQATDSVTRPTIPLKPGYSGPYSQKQSTSYCYALIFLSKQADGPGLVKAFETFNRTNFGAPRIKLIVDSLDTNRSILIVGGLGEKGTASLYLQKTVTDPSLSAILKGNNFRSFIISEENLKIFRNEKNLLKYMEFFNQLNAK
jgi:tetratricopeptide (TPR) repeat protein